MKTQLQQGTYQEAIKVLLDLPTSPEHSCFDVSIACRSGVWRLEFLGYAGAVMDRLIAFLQLHPGDVAAYPETGAIHEDFEGYRGRTPIRVTRVTKTIRRVDGRPQEETLFP